MNNIVRQNIKDLKPYIPGKPIEEVQRELGLKSVVKLASNENCLGPSPKAMKALRSGVTAIHRYPDASSYHLKAAIAASMGFGMDRLIVGNGSDEIIVLAIRTFVASGDEVVIAKPTFLIYEIAARIQGADIKYCPLLPDLKYDLRAMKAAITPRTRIIFIANPDNPTGTYVTKPELDEFFRGLPDDVMVFLDEAYFEFAAFRRKDYPNGLDYLKRSNTIVSRSFSKIYGLAGLRVGYGVSNTDFISYMERVRDPFNVNSLAQAAAIAALGDKAFLRKTLKHIEREKRFLYKALRRMSLEYTESATNFILIDLKRDCKAVFEALLMKGVIVREMRAWGFDTRIRVTVGTRKENGMFINALNAVLENKGENKGTQY